MNEGNDKPEKVYQRIDSAKKVLKIALWSYIAASSCYTIFFTIFEKSGLYEKYPNLEYKLTIAILIICVPYDIGQCFLQLYFMRVGFFIIRLMNAEKVKLIKNMMVMSYLYVIVAEILCIIWWLYPSVYALSFEDCSPAFLAFRPYLIYVYHFQYFV